MQLILEVEDSKAPFLLELLKNFDFVHVEKTISEEELDDLYCEKLYEESLQEVTNETIPWQEVRAKLGL
jgi:hypothetical protein